VPGEHQSLTISDINFQNFQKLVLEILKTDFSHYLGTFRLPCFAKKKGWNSSIWTRRSAYCGPAHGSSSNFETIHYSDGNSIPQLLNSIFGSRCSRNRQSLPRWYPDNCFTMHFNAYSAGLVFWLQSSSYYLLWLGGVWEKLPKQWSFAKNALVGGWWSVKEHFSSNISTKKPQN